LRLGGFAQHDFQPFVLIRHFEARGFDHLSAGPCQVALQKTLAIGGERIERQSFPESIAADA
jgi:hypothetical protein